ncbi:MAG: hypothetical protein PHX51_08310, partial [Clostridia bacterium]|nr:hypothetical protein [Clostridia bacterium]
MSYNSYEPNFPLSPDTLNSLLNPINGEFELPNLRLYEPCDSTQTLIKASPKIVNMALPNIIRIEKELMFLTAIDNTNADYSVLTVERGVG